MRRRSSRNRRSQHRSSHRGLLQLESSKMRIPEPSPITNPSRSRSNGRDACLGSSLRVDKARIDAKPATDIGVIALSAPPQIIASASPRSIRRKLSPIACAPAEHAVAVAEFGPFAPWRLKTSPRSRSPNYKERRTRSGPVQLFSCSRRSPEVADTGTIRTDHFGVRPSMTGRFPQPRYAQVQMGERTIRLALFVQN